MTFAYADAAQKSETMTDAEIINIVKAKLEKMYPGKIVDPKKIFRSKWYNDPFTAGSYTFLSTNSKLTDIEELAKPQNQIYFAGEHTHPQYFSTVHGAYLSGQRAAQEIIDAKI